MKIHLTNMFPNSCHTVTFKSFGLLGQNGLCNGHKVRCRWKIRPGLGFPQQFKTKILKFLGGQYSLHHHALSSFDWIV